MSVNRIDLLNHTFSRAFRGYDPDEVENVLHDAADAIARLNDERVRLMNRIAQLEERLAEFSRRETELRDTLVAMQRMVEDAKITAQKEAQAVLDAAQGRAEHVTNQANLRLARVLDEISDARKLKAQFEFKVRSVIESHLKLLEMSRMEDARMEQAAADLARRAAGSEPDE